MDIINQIERENMRMDIPVFRPGDTVKVHMRIVEGEKQRIQVFQGSVIRMHRGTTGGTFTVRKVSEGVGGGIHSSVKDNDDSGCRTDAPYRYGRNRY